MKTVKPSPTTSSRLPTEYEKLLLAAQAAQTAAERAVADLAALKRSLHEAPRQLELRREELAKAQAALQKVEAENEQNRAVLSQRQADAARLIEAAAAAQQALAQALINDDSLMLEEPGDVAKLMTNYSHAGAALFADSSAPAQAQPSRSPAARPAPAGRPGNPALSPAAAGRTSGGHADNAVELIDYLAERDVLCPSCGHNLRGCADQRCPDCRLLLTAAALKTVAPNLHSAPTWLWSIRALSAAAIILCGYLTSAALLKTLPFLCGGGSQCAIVVESTYSRLLGLPITLLAIPLYIAMIVATFVVNVGQRDSVRRRGWLAIGWLGLTLGAVSLWLLIVQAVFLKAFCPHCVIGDLIGVVVGFMVLSKAPLRRPEIRPEMAAGHVMIAGRRMGILAAAVLAVAGAVIALQLAASDGRSAAQQARDSNKKPAAEEDDLIFKPLKPMDKPKQSNPAGTPLIEKPAPPSKPDPAPPEPPRPQPAAKTPPVSPPAKPDDQEKPSFQLNPVE